MKRLFRFILWVRMALRFRTALIGVLLLFQCQQIKPYISGQVHIEYVPSRAMNKLIPLTIALPKSYFQKEHQTRRYPVVYLLHGYSGDYMQWLKITNLPALADQFETILVCPDGGYDSWYLDSPVADSIRYETHIIREVMTHIDTTYRTLGAKARAITGLSMGGHGALRFLALYPDSFVAAGSMSGILDLRVFPESWNLAGRLGPIDRFAKNWDDNSNVILVRRLKGRNKGILVDCGTDDFALAVNRAYRDSAAVHQVAIQYEELPGGHNREYWSSRIKPHLEFLKRYFDLSQNMEKTAKSAL